MYNHKKTIKNQKNIITVQHFATLHHTSPNRTSLHITSKKPSNHNKMNLTIFNAKLPACYMFRLV